METVCSTAGISGYVRPGQGIGDLTRAGFRQLMFPFGEVVGTLSLYDEEFDGEYNRKVYDRFMSHLAGTKLRIAVVKTPFVSPLLNGPKNEPEKYDDINDKMLLIASECIPAAEKIGCKNIIVQPLFYNIPRGNEWTFNRDFYLELAQKCKSDETKILLINQCRSINGHLVRGICSDGTTASEWVDELNEAVGMERFGFCLDTGECNFCGTDVQNMIKSLGSRIKAVILTENDGQTPSHLIPFSIAVDGSSTNDWLGVIRGLRESGFDGYLILDMENTARSFSPLLRPQLAALGKAVLDYFEMQINIENLLKRYDTIILFGAGNMCRNYMKCYGEKYPPLFTCDNNSGMWGTKFEGLEVRNPEELKNLPDDCIVVICNIYYREIEVQLRELGVRNIEYFNDEYMPSFYFDRIERKEA